MRILLLIVPLSACSGKDKSSGGTGNAVTWDASCYPASGDTLNTSCDPGFTQTSPNTADSIEVTFSGETLGQVGLPFSPNNEGDPVFVDGWDLSFTEILLVVGNFELSPGATQYADQSKLNDAVATRAGPYVVDMHDPSGFVGKDGVEPAGGIFKWDTEDDGTAFDTSTLYAFSYDTLPAQYPVANVNLTSSQQADYDAMVAGGWSKLYRGTATYVGTGTYPDSDTQAKFAAFPTTVDFEFGWNDATHNINCINPDNGTEDGEDLGNRGVQPNSDGASIAQVTLHVDHAFWDKLKQEGANLRFDPLAAWATEGETLDIRTLSTAPVAATFSDGTPLPDRAEVQNPPEGSYTSGESTSDGNITLDPNGVTTANVADIADFMAFSAQSQMHLNADGLCYIVGQQAADPYYNPSIQ